MSFSRHEVRAYVMSDDSMRRMTERMNEVRKARQQYSAMQILEASSEKTKVEAAVLSLERDIQTFDEIEVSLPVRQFASEGVNSVASSNCATCECCLKRSGTDDVKEEFAQKRRKISDHWVESGPDPWRNTRGSPNNCLIRTDFSAISDSK